MSDLYREAVERLSHVTGVRGAMLVETDAGVPIMAELTEGVEGAAAAALATSLYKRMRRAAETAEFGILTTLQLEAQGGHVIVADAGDLLVVAVAERNAQLGLVRLEAYRAAEALR